ncbi:MAG: formylmethanofuran dehydrogenase subunit A [Candidatus Bathyarchaeota archaeon]|nr:MAG: formylmethanofuran dehydrogenase subunit A [Candidatus Bathyarchaeota archaeon]
MKLVLKNGLVYDPLNQINGEKMDIIIKDGKIVEKTDKDSKTIDISGMIVMPGGVDIHAHIAGSEVNTGRLLRPEDHFKDVEVKSNITRSGVGRSIPSTFTTGYRYTRMGYTTVMNPSMPPLEARHTHEELNDIPIIDKGAYPLLGDWWFVLEYLKNGLVEDCAFHVAWMMAATKGYAIKLVNPGGPESWGFGRNVRDIDDTVPNFDITPREIIRGLCKVNKLLNLPHTIHLHTTNLGVPGNYRTTLKTMKCVEDLAYDKKPVMHITHVMFGAFKGKDWYTMSSGAEKISKYVNRHRHVTIDTAQVVFTDTTTMTADGPFQFGLYRLTGNKWVNHDVETETTGGIVPFRYKRKNYVHATQWSIGLELSLLIKSPWKVFLTTDHPNAAPFITYPRIIAWLMSKNAREKTMKKMNRLAVRKSLLPSIEREYSFYEIAIASRAGTAKALGLKQKGHLGIGADADIAVYNVNPKQVDPSKEYKSVIKAFKHAAYTIKNGEIVSQKGKIVKSNIGKTYWINVKFKSPPREITSDLKKKFKDYWTVEFDNYPVAENYLALSTPITVEAEI